VLLEGKQLGRYHFIRLLGSGGMGEVYLVEDPRIKQQVAIKVIRAESAPYPDDNATKEASRLFEREAIAVAGLDHPHILPLFDYGEAVLHGNLLTYLVMPYRPEGSLLDWLRRRGNAKLLSPQEVAQIIGQTAGALQHAHDRQIIHQDVKPSNLLVREQKETPNNPDILLADFGIAKSTTATASISQVIRGTPTYMAPEQWEAQPVVATDQYALAVMAYELLTGRPPFQGGSVQMMYQHLKVQAEPPSQFNPRMSTGIDAVLLQALAKKPGERYASVSAFANAFRQAAQSIDVSSSMKTPGALDSSISFVAPLPNITDSGKGTPTIDDSSNGSPVEAPTAPPITTTFQSDEAETHDSTSVTITKLPSDIATAEVMAKQGIDEAIAMGVDASSAVGGIGVLNSTPNMVSTPTTLRKGEGPLRRKGRRLLAIALVVLALLLALGSVVYAVPGGYDSLAARFFGGAASSATVTATPASVDLKRNYSIFAVTRNPDASKHQIQARRISNSVSQARTVNATGVEQVPGVQAQGSLTVINESCQTANYPVDSVFTGTDGVQVTTDALINLPDSCPNPTNGTATVPAHAVKAGASGNIPRDDIHSLNDIGGVGSVSCPTSTAMNNPSGTGSIEQSLMSPFLYKIPQSGGGYYLVCNVNAFSGGQDAYTQTIVKQSDVNSAYNAVKSLETSLTQNAQTSLKSMLHSNEQFVSSPKCNSDFTYDHLAGDSVKSVTATITVSCTVETYNQQGALSMAEQWLKQDAARDPGADYALVGNVVTTQTGAHVSDANKGTIEVSVTAEGVWVFQFNNLQKQALTKLIAGKKKEAVLSLLLPSGVTQANVQLNGGDGDTLPTDPTQIKFVIVSVKGK
jgi:serine/threonine protein kinase